MLLFFVKLFVHFKYRKVLFNTLFQSVFFVHVFKLLFSYTSPVAIFTLALCKFKITTIFYLHLFLSFLYLLQLFLFVLNDIIYFLNKALTWSAIQIFLVSKTFNFSRIFTRRQISILNILGIYIFMFPFILNSFFIITLINCITLIFWLIFEIVSALLLILFLVFHIWSNLESVLFLMINI